MRYFSTRDKNEIVSSSEAIVKGLSSSGGLFVPETFPEITKSDIENMINLSYKDKAVLILKKYLSDFSDEQIEYCASGAYNDNNFYNSEIAPLKKYKDNAFLIELWHGKTSAFKDMALSILPYLLTESAKNTGCDKEIIILVATSGDTGKAALDGFKNVKGTQILVFYPEDGVSDIQKLQMKTQEGDNVAVMAIKGNFDDAQNGVKQIFNDADFAKVLEKNGKVLSSANSINWGRLLPQIIYYFNSYCTLIKNNEITYGDKINICVPTGNFGNILAAYYAYKMGLPVNKFICASNVNNILTDFIKTGVYDRNRAFKTTISPSMDILISSNLERLIYDLSNKDDVLISDYTSKLSKTGRYELNDEIKQEILSLFECGYASDSDTKQTINEAFNNNNLLIDTHTSVGVKVYNDYLAKTNDNTKTIIASTASPFKFANSVLEAIDDSIKTNGDFDMLNKLSALSGVNVPLPLSELENKVVRFNSSCDKQEMKQMVCEIYNII